MVTCKISADVFRNVLGCLYNYGICKFTLYKMDIKNLLLKIESHIIRIYFHFMKPSKADLYSNNQTLNMYTSLRSTLCTI